MTKLDLTHQLAPGKIWAEIRFDDQATITQIIDKVANHTGSTPDHIKLQLRQTHSHTDGVMIEETGKCLHDYGVKDGMVLYVMDDDPNSLVKELAGSESGAPLYRMSDEEYKKRPGNAREFLSKLKAQRPELFNRGGTTSDNETVKAVCEALPIGSRCQVAEVTSLRGHIAWVGKVSEVLKREHAEDSKDDIMVAVRLDLPGIGNFDGKEKDGRVLVEGNRKQFYLVPHEYIRLGDFPPCSDQDLFDQDEI